jgi:hypothetical protein
MEKWDYNECINYECARETITLARAYPNHLFYEESRKERPDPVVLNRLNAECSRLFQERKNLRVKDHAEIARITTEYGAFIRSLDVNQQKAV